MTKIVLIGLAGYFAGSIPFGLLIGKAVKGIDLRDYGSGNIGATNASRVLGKKWGLICLVLDALKGFLPVAQLPRLFCSENDPMLVHVTVLCGVATIVGHMFPCWLGFRGGKGVATSLGVLLVLSPWGVLVAFVLFLISLAVWRYVSLSSIIAAIGFSAFEFVRLSPSPFSESNWSHAAFAIAVPTLILIQHRSNVLRLIKGQEPTLASRAGVKEVEEAGSGGVGE